MKKSERCDKQKAQRWLESSSDTQDPIYPTTKGFPNHSKPFSDKAVKKGLLTEGTPGMAWECVLQQ